MASFAKTVSAIDFDLNRFLEKTSKIKGLELSNTLVSFVIVIEILSL